MKSNVKNSIDSAIGKVFKSYRKKYHLTQTQVADKLGISEKYISRLENGNSGVKLETLINYMNTLGIAPDVLFKDLVKCLKTDKNLLIKLLMNLSVCNFILYLLLFETLLILLYLKNPTNSEKFILKLWDF